MAHIDQLSDDVTKSILSRLQLDFLIKCKCVSKRWKDLVTEIIQEWKEKMKGVILVNFVPVDFPGMYFPRYSYASPHADVYNLDLALDYLPCRLFTVRDCCNGNLLCIGSNHPVGNYYICNPVTRKWVVLPDSQPMSPDQHDVLAFDPSSPHYKVLRWFKDSLSGQQYAELDVYSSTTRTWSRRRISYHRRSITYPRLVPSVFIKGFVFRLADPNVVVALDVSDDLIPPAQVINLPYQDSDNTTHRCLGKWGGLLCYMDYNRTRIKIWVLEDLSRRKWVLKLVISVQRLLNLIPGASRIDNPFLPVAFHAEKEEIILEVPEGVVCYELKTSKFVGMYSIDYLRSRAFPFRDVIVYPFSASFHCP